MKKKLIYLQLMLLLIACKTKNEPAADIDQPHFFLNEALKKNTEISVASEEPIVEQLTLTGKIEYDQNDLVSFKSLLNGVVQEVKFELGDFVKKGQVLAVIKSNDIIVLSQQKRIFENQEKLLKSQISSKKEMLNDGLATLPEVNQLETDLMQVRVEIQKISETLSMYSAGTSAGLYNIISPKNGYIVQKEISVGQTVSMEDEPLFSISNLKEVWVMVNIYASNLKYIQEGSKVKVRTIAYPDVYYDGKIDKIYNVFDDNEHVLKARVILQNQNLKLLPGLSADIFIDKNIQAAKAIAIPRKAVIFNNDRQYVVAYKDDHHLEIRKIAPVAENELFIYTKEGIQAGEKIITKNALLIYEGVLNN